MREDPELDDRTRASGRGARHTRTIAKLVIAAFTMVMLLSMGAQFFLAPVLLPSLWWASNSSARWRAAYFSVLAGVLMAEVGWLVAYSTVRERQPWIVVIPALVLVSTVAFFWYSHPSHPRRRRG